MMRVSAAARWSSCWASRRLSAAIRVALLLPYALLAIVALSDPRLIGVLLALCTMPMAYMLVRDLPRSLPGLPYNGLLFRTFKLQMLFGACYTIGALTPGLAT
jgi:hypothetical protein